MHPGLTLLGNSSGINGGCSEKSWGSDALPGLGVLWLGGLKDGFYKETLATVQRYHTQMAIIQESLNAEKLPYNSLNTPVFSTNPQ